jgi:hypothetical protein
MSEAGCLCNYLTKATILLLVLTLTNSARPVDASVVSYSTRSLKLLAKSTLPMLLPYAFPQRVLDFKSISPVVLDAGRSGYAVVWSPDPKCAGAFPCTQLALYATKVDPTIPQGKLISTGTVGKVYFSPSRCMMHCTDEILTIIRDNTQYVFDSKLGIGESGFVQLVKSLKPG